VIFGWFDLGAAPCSLRAGWFGRCSCLCLTGWQLLAWGPRALGFGSPAVVGGA